MPEVRRVIENPLRHGEFGLAARMRLARRLRAEAYDAAIVLPNTWKSALVPWLAGIPLRIGYTGEARYGLINRRHTPEESAGATIAERYARLAESPGAAPLSGLPEPRLAADPEHRAATLARLGLERDASPVALCPGAEYGPAKRWPEQYWARIAASLAARGHAVWLIGSEKDAATGQAIAQQAGAGCRDLCGRSTLDEAIELIGAARLVITNDSGLMHVAAALDRPMIALFGSSTPRYTPPLSKNAETIWLELPCSPCFERVCPLGHFRCMREITPERVEARAFERLER
ncbi:MAG: lipopolysaccharide heptosyltransferase II [Rhodocyclaceae bacterium]